jgi:hypothetical protein
MLAGIITICVYIVKNYRKNCIQIQIGASNATASCPCSSSVCIFKNNNSIISYSDHSARRRSTQVLRGRETLCYFFDALREARQRLLGRKARHRTRGALASGEMAILRYAEDRVFGFRPKPSSSSLRSARASAFSSRRHPRRRTIRIAPPAAPARRGRDGGRRAASAAGRAACAAESPAGAGRAR